MSLIDDAKRRLEEVRRGQAALEADPEPPQTRRNGRRHRAGPPPEPPPEPPVDDITIGPSRASIQLIPDLLLSVAELKKRAGAVKWAVKHIVRDQGVGFIFGASRAFKSFVALDYALHRCYGMSWLGKRTKKATPIYIAAEGGASFSDRIEAWHKDRGMIFEDCPMRVVILPLTLRTQSVTLRQSIEREAIATGETFGDIIIDTFSQTFTGEENSNESVAEFLRILGTELRDELHCTVTIVHHTGHVATERPRGASAIFNNSDFAFGVFRDEKELMCTVEFKKIKDAREPDDVSFSLSTVDLGTDEDGEQITSLSASHIKTQEDLAALIEHEAKAGRSPRNGVFMALVQNGIDERTLRKAFCDDLNLTDPDARKKAYQRARKKATDAGLIEVVDGTVLLLRRRGG